MASQNNYLYGYDMFINNSKVIPSSTIKFTYDYSNVITKKKNAQDEIKQMIFSPPATVVKWSDGDKTVVKVTDKDDYDPIFGFLMAYFQKHSGMTKTQVGKFCDSIIEEFGKQQEKKNKKKNAEINKNEFKVGDRVIGVNNVDGRVIKNVKGTIVEIKGYEDSEYDCAIRFDKNIDGWGDEELNVDSGYGLYVTFNDIKKL